MQGTHLLLQTLLRLKIYIFYSTQYKVNVNNYVRSDIKYAIINKILGGRLRETMA